MTKWAIDYIAQPRVAAMGVRRNAVVKMQWLAPHIVLHSQTHAYKGRSSLPLSTSNELLVL